MSKSTDLSAFLLEPAPFGEASDFLKSKPVVSRRVFEQLLPELKARAFLISGIEVANVLQSVRDRIADIPLGADWDEVKKDVINDISPFLVDENATAEERAKQALGASARAELLLRLHGFQAYQAANYDVMKRQEDVFPYWQYLTMEDEKVRPAHAALDGVVLPSNHPFWNDHYPPWDWGCRCQVVPLSHDDVAEIHAADAEKAPDEKRILEGAVLERLETHGQLVRGPTNLVDVRSPRAKGKDGAFHWNPADMRITVEQLKDRYDAPVWAAFENFARGTEIEHGVTVWDWIGGKRILPPSAPVVAPTSAAETIDDAWTKAGLNTKQEWTASDVEKLIKELKESSPELEKNVIASITGASEKGAIKETRVRRAVQDVLDLLPADVVKTLPPLKINISRTISGAPGAAGTYERKTGQLGIATKYLAHLPESQKLNQMRSTLFHELMHWIHLEATGPAAEAYRARIAAHYAARTAGDRPVRVGSGLRRDDQWWWNYAGTEYGWEKEAAGLEVPTVYFQLMSDPQKLAALRNSSGAAFDETLKLVLSVFYL
jgi:SPP1 gp7 family putative phage head morphogenesis protein